MANLLSLVLLASLTVLFLALPSCFKKLKLNMLRLNLTKTHKTLMCSLGVINIRPPRKPKKPEKPKKNRMPNTAPRIGIKVSALIC